MNTILKRIGFFSLMTVMLVGFSSCQEDEVAKATVTVLQEFTASQGAVNQTAPVENAEVRFYVPKQGAEHLETIAVTDANGQVGFSYKYEVRVFAEVTYQGTVFPRKLLIMKLGETNSTEIILPE